VEPRFEDAFIDILGGGPGGRSELGEKAPKVETMTKDVIVADKLTKKFGNFTAADSISLTVKKGEVFGLLGPNGAGKSTTFKMLCGLLKPTSGTAHVNGFDLRSASSQARSHIGYMAQKFSLYGNLSVEQNLSFFAGIYSAGKDAIDEMIETFNLEGYLNTSAEMLPLGYKQRLALACANMHHPEVLFLDEPTSGVDPITRREFWNHINALVQKGVTVMITTHFMDEAEYCDRIALIYAGKMVALATPSELKEKARSDANPNPTLEDAFVKMIEGYNAKQTI
jgi:ABC-2 type transport system ATP-binding protein